MRHLLSLSLLACGEPIDLHDAPQTFSPGVYTGTFQLELNASFGLWESETEQCESDLTVIIEPGHTVAPIRGRVYCETPTLGGNLLDIQGDLVNFPEIDGELFSNTRADSWEGWFIDEECLVAEVFGSIEQNGVTVDYSGDFSACLDLEALPPGMTPEPSISLDEAPSDGSFLLR